MLQFRDAPLNASWPGLTALGPLHHGCPDPAAPVPVPVPPPLPQYPPSWTVSLAAPAVADGWYFATPASAPRILDPVRFVLEGSHDGQAWVAAGHSAATVGERGRICPLPWARHHGPPGDGGAVRFDLRPPVAWLVAWGVPHVAGGLLYWAAIVVAAAGRSLWARRLGVVCYGGHAGALSVTAVVYVVYAATRAEDAVPAAAAAAAAAGRAVCWASLCALLLWRERAFVYWVWAVGVQSIVTEAAVLYYLEAAGNGDGLDGSHYNATDAWLDGLKSASLAQFGLLEIAFSALCFLARHYLLREVDSLVRQDRDLYRAVWARLCSTPGCLDSLGRLARMTRPFETGGRARQLNLVPPSSPATPMTPLLRCLVAAWPGQGAASAEGRLGVHARRAGGTPVLCLDRLVAEASGARAADSSCVCIQVNNRVTVLLSPFDSNGVTRDPTRTGVKGGECGASSWWEPTRRRLTGLNEQE